MSDDVINVPKEPEETLEDLLRRARKLGIIIGPVYSDDAFVTVMPPEPEAKGLTERQQILADYMRMLSEDLYSAGWMQDFEFLLWQRITTGQLRTLSRERADLLRDLSKLCGGWIAFNNDANVNEFYVFVPLEEWKAKYAQWAEAQAKKEAEFEKSMKKEKQARKKKR